MDWNRACEQAALGAIGYGLLALLLSHNFLVATLAVLAGAVVHGSYGAIRDFEWAEHLQSNGKQACVSITRDLRFYEISNKAPANMGFIRFQNLDKKELFAKLEGKRLNPETIPFHMRVHMEERRSLEIPWEAIEPHLRAE